MMDGWNQLDKEMQTFKSNDICGLVPHVLGMRNRLGTPLDNQEWHLQEEQG